MTLVGRQFDFHDIIHHIHLCNNDNRRVNSFLQVMGVPNVRKNTSFSTKKCYRKFLHSVQDGGIDFAFEGFMNIF